MHIPTHAMAGWCLANLAPLTPRERLLTMVAATASDLDGLTLLAGIEAYAKWHHTFGHNALFSLVLAAVLAGFSHHRVRSLLLYFAAVHLHLAMDYFGSGPGWGIPYLWPFSGHAWESAHAWNLASWQNFVAGLAAMAGCIAIGFWRKRSPFEWPRTRRRGATFRAPNPDSVTFPSSRRAFAWKHSRTSL